MTLAMFPVLTSFNYNHTEQWQRYTKMPSDHPLNAVYITRLTQKIQDVHRMGFLKLRIRRQKSNAVVACDSTTRSAYGRCLADIRWGNNKDNEALQNTLEVVVYSLDSHEPIYYRTFGGNENDSRTLRTIVSDLNALGCRNLNVIFDRGYESEENIDNMIRASQTFLVCGKTGQNPVINSIYMVKYDSDGMPTEMDYSPEYKLYAQQFEEKRIVKLEDGGEKEAVLKVNLFLNMRDRIQELTKINECIKGEKKQLEGQTVTGITDIQLKSLRKTYQYHKFRLNKDKVLEIEPNGKQITKEKAKAGFFSSVSWNLEGDAFEQYELYVLRDEQEKYFEEMRDQLGFTMQKNWSEDGKTGRLFLLFIGLILRSELRHIWGEKLRKEYPSSLDVLHEMIPIRFVEYEDGSTHVTAFTKGQTEICRVFGISIPEDCLSAAQEKEINRKTAGRKPGRPKGSLNRKKVIGQF